MTREEVGGYKPGGKPMSEWKQPPRGPATGAWASAQVEFVEWPRGGDGVTVKSIPHGWELFADGTRVHVGTLVREGQGLVLRRSQG